MVNEKDFDCWIISSGLIGCENQCIGLADQLKLKYKIKRVKPSRFLSLTAPYGTPKSKNDIIAPYPKFIIGAGRKIIPYIKNIKKNSNDKCFTIYLQNPKINTNHFDLVWAPNHDNLKGDNVISTLLSPGRVSNEFLQFETATGALGTATVSGKSSHAVTGVVGTTGLGAVSTVSDSVVEAVLGDFGTTALGSVSVAGASSVTVTGVSATVTPGTASTTTVNRVLPTGVAATGAVGCKASRVTTAMRGSQGASGRCQARARTASVKRCVDCAGATYRRGGESKRLG